LKFRSSTRFALPLTLAAATVAGAAAHDIPADAAARLFLRPSGQRLQVLARVPLKAIRDVEFPETRSGYLDAARLAPRLPDAAALWIAQPLEIYEDGVRLDRPRVAAVQLSLEADRSFATFDQALRRVTAPLLENDSNAVWNQVHFDVLLEYRIRSDRSAFSVRPGLERMAARVTTVLRFLPPGGTERAFEFTGDPGVVPLDPSWAQAGLRFVRLGFFHILDGTDHLLFLLCLVIPFRRLRPLILVVTGFTVAHSATLVGSAFGLAPDALWFPPLVETLIAASIVYMALENIAGSGGSRRRWLTACGFGLVHGFGFSFALRETLQFAGSHVLTSLAGFNLGVEIGQVLVLALLAPALEALFRYGVAERMGTIILSALIAHTGWHWMTERAERLRQYRFELPALNAALAADALGWLLLLLSGAGAVWAASRLLREKNRQTEGKEFRAQEE
jgi:hypothetical protein